MQVRLPNRGSGGAHCSRHGVRSHWPDRQIADIKGYGVVNWLGNGIGILLALLGGTEEVCMFALSAILIGVIGVFYVRRRSSRKKQSV